MMFITSVSNTEWRKNMQCFIRHTFHWIFRKYMVEWEIKISWMVESACKIRKSSLTACIDDWTIAVFGCYERYKVTSLTVIQSPIPYYEMEYSSTDNIMTYFPYWCNYTRRCDDIYNCGVHQYARPLWTEDKKLSFSIVYKQFISITWSFPIANFPFICSNIPAAPAYGAYISQLIRYSRACGSYLDFLDIGLLLTRTLLTEGFLLVNWSHHFESFTVATTTWLTIMEYMCHKWPRICSTCRKHLPVLSSLMT
jgi:hypothetical protein